MAHILVVDDEEHLRNIYEQYLLHDGHTVRTAGDGRAAVKLIGTNRFDLVITDIVMPEQDGLGLLLELGKLADPPPVIVISGGSHRLDPYNLLALAKAMKAHTTLTKPVSYEKMHAEVDALLTKKRCQNDN